jgi:hypothetical protein
MYTDPGLLSLIIASIAGAVIAVPFYLVKYRRKVGEWIDSKRRNHTPKK